MRKFVCAALGAVMLFAALGLASCAKGENGRCTYTMNAEYFPDSKTLACSLNAEIVNPVSFPLEELKFQLWANAYREGAKNPPVSSLFSGSAYYAGKSYGGIEITGMVGAESFAVTGDDANILTVALKEPIAPGDSATVGMDFTVTLPAIDHRLGVTRETVNLSNFYPVLCYLTEEGFHEYLYSSNGDPFVSEIANYRVDLTVPESYVLASGFSAEERSAEEGKRTYHVCADGVRDIAFVLGENLRSVSEMQGDREVVYYYVSDPSPEAALRCASESLAFFSERFGDYPHSRYAVVQTGFVYGGMEYPALSMISTSLSASEMPAVIAHETAHQWWYGTVGSNQYEHAWQDEGLAEYSAALFFEAHPAYGIGYRDCVSASEQSYRAFYSVYSQVHGEADTTMNRPLSAFSGEYEYRNIAYDKGVILFDRVREVAGEKKLMAALKKYASAYGGKIATEEDFVGCFSGAGSNVGEIFRSFTEGRCVI